MFVDTYKTVLPKGHVGRPRCHDRKFIGVFLVICRGCAPTTATAGWHFWVLDSSTDFVLSTGINFSLFLALMVPVDEECRENIQEPFCPKRAILA